MLAAMTVERRFALRGAMILCILPAVVSSAPGCGKRAATRSDGPRVDAGADASTAPSGSTAIVSRCTDPAETLCGGPPLPELAGDPRWPPAHCAKVASDRDNCGLCGNACPEGYRCERSECTKIGLDAEEREACTLLADGALRTFAGAGLAGVREALCGSATPSCSNKTKRDCARVATCTAVLGSGSATCSPDGVCTCQTRTPCTPDVAYKGCFPAAKRTMVTRVRLVGLCRRTKGRWVISDASPLGACECPSTPARPVEFVPERGCVSGPS